MTFDGNYVEFDNINDYKNWYEFDTLEYGHCFTFDTPPGIKFVRMKLHTVSQLTFHTPGILLIRNDGGQKRQDLASIALNKGYISIDIDYEYHQLLDVDYGGFPCYKDKEYRKDYCHEQFVEKKCWTKSDVYLHLDSINPKFVNNMRILPKFLKFIFVIIAVGRPTIDVIILVLFSHLYHYILKSLTKYPM